MRSTGPFDGEESITLLADLDAGATGTMPSALLPDLIKPVLAHHRAGRRNEAAAAYARILPLINYENRQCGLRATKAVMAAGGVIRSDAVRHPLEPLHPATRAGLLELAARLESAGAALGKMTCGYAAELDVRIALRLRYAAACRGSGDRRPRARWSSSQRDRQVQQVPADAVEERGLIRAGQVEHLARHPAAERHAEQREHQHGADARAGLGRRENARG